MVVDVHTNKVHVHVLRNGTYVRTMRHNLVFSQADIATNAMDIETLSNATDDLSDKVCGGTPDEMCYVWGACSRSLTGV